MPSTIEDFSYEKATKDIGTSRLAATFGIIIFRLKVSDKIWHYYIVSDLELHPSISSVDVVRDD